MINLDDSILDDLNEQQAWLLLRLVRRINKDGICWPAMKTILQDTGWKDARTVRKVCSELEGKGILKVHQWYEQGKGQTSNRYEITTDKISVFVTIGKVQRMNDTPLHEMSGAPLHEMHHEVLTRELSISSPVQPEAGFSDEVRQIVSYLNEVTGSKYKASSNKTKRSIKARLNEGFSVDDFYLVIDDRERRWGTEPKMRQYLRPETLFGTKFEGYLQAAQNAPTANTDDQLNDMDLQGDELTAYNEYISYTIDTYNDLYRSECKVLSKRDWNDYKKNETLPGLPFRMTPNEKKGLLIRVHDRLNRDTFFRKKYPSVFECFVQSARAIINRQNPVL